MIEKKDILAMVRHVTRQSRGIRDHQIVHPMREWMLGVGVVTVGVLVGVFYSFLVYNRTVSDQMEQAVVPMASVPYQAVIVEQALSEYGGRRSRYDSVLVSVPIPAPIEPEIIPESASTTSEEISPAPVLNEEDTIPPATFIEGDLPQPAL